MMAYNAIHEGDGPRLLETHDAVLETLWAHQYALEAIHLPGAVHSTATPRVAHELTWCRFVNNRGGAGNNIPVDLYMEHLNRTLKDYITSSAANVSEASIVRASHSLHSLLRIASQFDECSGIEHVSLHHTSREYGKDLELILRELVLDSKVFDYVPGRHHHSFQNIKPHITSHLDIDKLVEWIKFQINKISNVYKLSNIFHPH